MRNTMNLKQMISGIANAVCNGMVARVVTSLGRRDLYPSLLSRRGDALAATASLWGLRLRACPALVTPGVCPAPTTFVAARTHRAASSWLMERKPSAQRATGLLAQDRFSS